MNRVRAAVIGFGNMGTAHAACIHGGGVDGMTLSAVCDIDEARLAVCREKYPDVVCTTDWRTLLDGSIDAMIIAVPHPLHCAIAMEAMQSGLHVLVEKPLDVTLTQARAMADLHQKHPERVFGVMLNQRTNPIFQRAREIVQGGELGELKRSVWIITNWYRTQSYYDSGSWRATWVGEGGGVLLNQAPHNLDLWQWICGMPVSVKAECDIAHYHNIEVEDDATLMVRYTNGAAGLFITSTGEYPGTNRLEISGTKGKLLLENGTLTFVRLAQDEAEVRFQSKESFAQIPYKVDTWTPDQQGEGHRGILQNFTDAILKGTPLLAPGEDGLYELTLSNAAYLSSWMGGNTVHLPFDTDTFDRMLAEKREASSCIKEAKRHDPDGSYNKRWQTNW